MKGEHGERGHGQKEGSWWNEKALIPFFGKYLLSPCFYPFSYILPLKIKLAIWDKRAK